MASTPNQNAIPPPAPALAQPQPPQSISDNNNNNNNNSLLSSALFRFAAGAAVSVAAAAGAYYYFAVLRPRRAADAQVSKARRLIAKATRLSREKENDEEDEEEEEENEEDGNEDRTIGSPITLLLRAIFFLESSSSSYANQSSDAIGVAVARLKAHGLLAALYGDATLADATKRCRHLQVCAALVEEFPEIASEVASSLPRSSFSTATTNSPSSSSSNSSSSSSSSSATATIAASVQGAIEIQKARQLVQEATKEVWLLCDDDNDSENNNNSSAPPPPLTFDEKKSRLSQAAAIFQSNNRPAEACAVTEMKVWLLQEHFFNNNNNNSTSTTPRLGPQQAGGGAASAAGAGRGDDNQNSSFSRNTSNGSVMSQASSGNNNTDGSSSPPPPASLKEKSRSHHQQSPLTADGLAACGSFSLLTPMQAGSAFTLEQREQALCEMIVLLRGVVDDKNARQHQNQSHQHAPNASSIIQSLQNLASAHFRRSKMRSKILSIHQKNNQNQNENSSSSLNYTKEDIEPDRSAAADALFQALDEQERALKDPTAPELLDILDKLDVVLVESQHAARHQKRKILLECTLEILEKHHHRHLTKPKSALSARHQQFADRFLGTGFQLRLANCLTELGSLLVLEKAYSSAIERLQKAVDICMAHVPSDHVQQWQSMFQLAMAVGKNGEELKKEQLLQASVEIAEAMGRRDLIDVTRKFMKKK